MQVIGSGFGRTGTTSMKAALEMLGFGPCYHMEEVFPRPRHVAAWNAWADGSPVDLTRLLARFESAVDFPASLAYQDLMVAFPDAKVVHTVRDADRWYDSTAATIHRASELLQRRAFRVLPVARHLGPMLDAVIWDGVFDGRFPDRSHAIGVYVDWTARVEATVPADRLLVFEVAQGWEPLCAFLEVPVPDAPFPRANDTATFQRRLRAIEAGSWLPALAVTIVTGAGARALRRARRTRRN